MVTYNRQSVPGALLGHVLANAGGTVVACGNNTKGTAVNIGGSSPGYAPCFEVILSHNGWGSGSSWGNYMVDIKQGSEIIVADFAKSAWGGTNSEYWGASMFCPIPLRDSQISVEAACEQDTKDIYVYIVPYHDHPVVELGLQCSTTYGVQSNQQGKPVTAGNGANGTWTEIDGNTSDPIRAIAITLCPDADASQFNLRAQIELGINDGGTRYAITEKKPFFIFGSNNSWVVPLEWGFDIPAGVDLQARIVGSAAETVNVVVHTFY